MKLLVFATILLFGVWSECLQATAAEIDYEELPVGWGETFYDVEVLGSDRYGLMFRHRAGIAKVDYAWLPIEVEDEFAPSGKGAAVTGDGKSSGFQVAGEPAPTSNSLVVTVTTRVPVSPGYGYTTGSPYPGYGWSLPRWKLHWPRFHPAHLLVDPYWRALATQDFLYSAGLTPRPCGISTYFLSHRRPRLYF